MTIGFEVPPSEVEEALTEVERRVRAELDAADGARDHVLVAALATLARIVRDVRREFEVS